ncbi:hypothetical protein QPK32_00350 [Massilia sp. YIM B02763]|uniref:hypothetical protein n=1 Tax=Massilia sp. YIM B02763 TaxID=3050130 RepID=UPI0025B72132|nr:hypothetical protein [Massilia sp. YIM B02763]MDN4051534.1 hypothetical protein [Massilia sp. YIM B02763]
MFVPRTDEHAINFLPPYFDPDYVEHAVKPFMAGSIITGEKPLLPLIDTELTKEKAIPPHIFGMLYEDWTPNMDEEGLSVFLQGYENRGPDNERKRIYYTAFTPDLYPARYQPKMAAFMDKLFVPEHAGKPLMQAYYGSYFDLYWDLHLGVSGEQIPDEIREIGKAFNTVIGFWFPTSDLVYQSYMKVRKLRPFLRDWVDARVEDILQGRTPGYDKTIVHSWIKNGELKEHFRRKDIVFECFHNFLAFSQWGNTLFNIVARLSDDDGDPAVKDWFARTMADPDRRDASPFTPLDRFAMELFRVISPNGGSYSLSNARQSISGQGYNGVLTLHPTSNRNPLHWPDPDAFNPDRYLDAPLTSQHDEAAAQQAGLRGCPFARKARALRDGRDGTIENSGYGAVYAVVDGVTYPVPDTPGYAPFGFGYRRCPGELFTIGFVQDFLRKVHAADVRFEKLADPHPAKLPVGPITVIDDRYAFRLGR